MNANTQHWESESDVFWEPADDVTSEIKIRRSLFIGHLFPCKVSEEVRLVLARVEAVHKDATHNCWGYSLGPEPRIEYASDDGEPAGTAGKPILAALRQSGMTNLMIVVTRYFGGIKLGVRGLIEAYGQAATDAVSRAERIMKVRSRKLVICLPYAIIGDVTHLLNGNGMVDVPAWNYGADVEVTASIRLSATARTANLLDELQARKLIYSWSWALPN